ncbi:hypothetical protein BaRGS_00004144 [Batillaria attramentaria]|uniref:HMG box domain-containing protein n=1 Tax=Batillaria attramentaria TaxID=370345 RepID=A0ABD0LZV1_9CAEN
MYIDSSRLKELAAESTFIPKSIRRRRKSTMDVFAPNPLRASSHLTHNAESEESVASYLLKEIDLLSQAALQINQPPAKTSLGLDVATSAHNHEENCPQKPPKHHSLCSVDPVFCLSGIPCASLAHDGSMETFDLVEYADCCKETSPSDGLKGLNCQMAEVTISKCGDDLPTASSSTENSSTEEEWTKIKEWKNLNTARRDATEPRRPKNGFLRFSSKFRREIAARHPRLDNRDISKLLGAKWRKMTAEEKRPYEQEFAQDIRKIRDKNPRWRYAPARYSQDELVEPMPNRLRPHDKIKRKKYEDVLQQEPRWTDE